MRTGQPEPHFFYFLNHQHKGQIMNYFLKQWLAQALREWLEVNFTPQNVETVLRQAMNALKKKAEETNTQWDDAAIAGIAYIILNTENIERFVALVKTIAAGNICADPAPGTPLTISQEIAPLFVEWAKQ